MSLPLLLLSLSLAPAVLSNPISPHPRSAAEQILPGVAAVHFTRSIIPSGQGAKYDANTVHGDAARVAAKYSGNVNRYSHNLAIAAAAAAGGREKRDAWEEGGQSWYRRERDGDPLDVKKYRREKRQTGSVPLSDFFQQSSDWAYFGPASIGTPAQNFTLNFDTGSADIWVPAQSSPSRHNKFNEGASSTFQGSTRAWDIRYGSGEAQGFLASDTFTVGGLTHPQQTFALSNTTVSLFERLPMDGLMGMGFSTIAESGAATFFENLINSRAVADDVFQFYLQRAYDITQELNGVVGGGELILGGTDSSRYTGAVTYSPVTLKGYWEIEMQGIAINGTLIPNSAVAAAIDTGTSLVYLPTRITRSFFSPLGGRQLDDGTYSIPCSTPDFQISLQFGGVQFTISEDDWFLGYAEDPTYCIVGIVGQDQTDPNGQPVAIIGDLFLKNVVSIYDYNGGVNGAARIGFANAVKATSTSPGVGNVSSAGVGGASGTRSDNVPLNSAVSRNVQGVSSFAISPPPTITSVIDVTYTPGVGSQPPGVGQSTGSGVGPVNTFAPKGDAGRRMGQGVVGLVGVALGVAIGMAVV